MQAEGGSGLYPSRPPAVRAESLAESATSDRAMVRVALPTPGGAGKPDDLVTDRDRYRADVSQDRSRGAGPSIRYAS